MADMSTGRPVQRRAEAFTFDFVDNKSKLTKSSTNLQDSFIKFKKERQREIRREKKMRKRRKKKQRDPQAMMELRKKFLNQAKKYFGVPYAKKYWTPDSEEYYSKIFLDCCGLVRQVMRDLEKDFGFRLGPWNQAYMYDTLPITISSEKDMKPGDLVFMSGVYPSPKARQQKHFMTHVEIWAGDGCKTIGARWNNGKVQVWDHYKFEAKSFHSAQYYFKSIDTWLMGVCKSFCKQHKWKRRKFNPSKKSVFSLKQNQENTKKETENLLEVVGRGEQKTNEDTQEMASHTNDDFPEADVEGAVDDYDELENEDSGSSSEDEGDVDDQQGNSGSEDGTESESEDINALPESMEALECQSSLSTRVATVIDRNSNAIENQDGSGTPYKKKEDLHIRKRNGLEMSMQKSIFINGNTTNEDSDTSLCAMTAKCTVQGQGSRSSSSLRTTEGNMPMKVSPPCFSDPGLNKLKFK